MKVELIDYTDDGIHKVYSMAKATRQNKFSLKWDTPGFRDAYKEMDKEEKFVKGLLKVKHFGILEHINFTFHVSEISRCLTHQLVRHRIASYLQMSSRHVKPIKNNYVMPHTIPEYLRDDFGAYMNSALKYYNDLIESGVPIEDARYILPPAFFTHISITMNCRELRHFFELRCHKSAQWEIRNLASEMLKICYEKYPVIFEDLYKKYS